MFRNFSKVSYIHISGYFSFTHVSQNTHLVLSIYLLPALPYQVKVYTGRDKGNGTDSNVYLTLIGERGDSGQRMLFTSLEHDIPFQPRAVSSFL